MKDTLAVRVRFGAFELDLHTGELHGREETVQLGEKPFRVLLILTEREGELATREEIQKKLWPNNTVVDFEHGINAAIKSLRRALGDSADNPKYIETLARHGYRLIVPVAWVNAGKDGEGRELRPAVLTGRTVSHYRVLDIIGGGGMGVVYRAEDLKLGRQVALKFLPEELGSDPLSLERFSREARAASSLDHPNICHIYEFGEHEGRPFIVMQLMEGQTLRDRLARNERALPPAELLDIGIQVSDALQAAHEKGIVHRDIKPANIFLTSKGAVKILDFGLAKLVFTEENLQLSSRVEPPAFGGGVEGSAVRRVHATADPSTPCRPDPSASSGQAPQNSRVGEEGRHSAQDDSSKGVDGTPFDKLRAGSKGVPFQNAGAAEAAPLHPVTPADPALTRTGVAMGTAGYMSPEQVRGEKLDARTDIFSFGLVLYEMATGQRAFTGETAAVVHDAILNRPPTAIRELNSALPAKLVTTIEKALKKDRGRRFQTAAELGSELGQLRDATKPWRTKVAAKGTRRWSLWLAALLLILVAGLAIARFVWRRLGPPPKLAERQLTTNAPGNRVTAGAISPDGKYMAYHDQTGLYLRNIASGETHLVGLPGALPSGPYGALLWFPGHRKLLAWVDGNGIWVIPISGEEQPHLLYENAEDPAISPDGQMIAFIGQTHESGRERRHELWVGSVNGDTPRKLAAAEETEYLSGPAWSPDGQWITYGKAWKPAEGLWHSAIEVCPATGGPAKTFLAESSLPKSNTFVFVSEEAVFSATWFPDWRLVFSVTRGSEPKIENSLWQVRVKPGTTEAGNPELVTQWDQSLLVNLAGTTDNKRLSFVKNRSWVDVYAGELGSESATMKVRRSLARIEPGASGLNSWAHDGQAVFLSSVRNGQPEIFRQRLNETAAEKVVTGSRDAFGAQISPDGAWLLYLESEPTRIGDIADSVWLMRRPTNGGPAEKVLELPAAEFDSFRCRYNPQASSPCVLALREGKDMVFYSLDPLHGKGSWLGKIAVFGFPWMRGWDVSPDGSRVAVVSAHKYGARIEVLTLASGAWHDIAAEPAERSAAAAREKETKFCQVAWAADGKGFFVTAKMGDAFNLLHVTSDGKVQPLLASEAFQDQFMDSPLPSPDGKYLAFTVQTWDGNVWMMDNF
jgi:serine/threonine protein kinase/Tol biopolymer transport system component